MDIGLLSAVAYYVSTGRGVYNYVCMRYPGTVR